MALTRDLLCLFVDPRALEGLPDGRVEVALRQAEGRFDVTTREGEARACEYAGEVLRRSRGLS